MLKLLCALPGCIKGMLLFCLLIGLAALLAYQLDPTFFR